ncbi:unnamed protein product [Didymodactylos carnosus]|uniref:Uncharacterized protein n=1 Tax=Didymodactylos carnosus TaxID=1234261 RepID=A0A815EUF3_9BILA|nr:unnamed protein product [Didymodactylos carnosus]CAF4159592.1 unnamed protein product [Didymodactylos carnosus]
MRELMSSSEELKACIHPLNLYLMIVGPSGAGKSNIVNKIKDAATKIEKLFPEEYCKPVQLGADITDEMSVVTTLTGHGLRKHLASQSLFLINDEPDVIFDGFGVYDIGNSSKVAENVLLLKAYDGIKDESRSTASTKVKIASAKLSMLAGVVGTKYQVLILIDYVQNIMMSITRPTCRGKLFHLQYIPHKPLLSRHYEAIELKLIFPHFRFKYLTSYARQTGGQIDCEKFEFISYHELNLISYQDGLIRRPKVNWNTKMMNVNLKQAKMWLVNGSGNSESPISSSDNSNNSMSTSILKDEATTAKTNDSSMTKPTHSILIDELKAIYAAKEGIECVKENFVMLIRVSALKSSEFRTAAKVRDNSRVEIQASYIFRDAIWCLRAT